MQNILNKKILDMLSNIDKNKINEVSKMLGNMSKEDMASLTQTLNNTLNNNKNNKK